jgi:hypothetical protein
MPDTNNKPGCTTADLLKQAGVTGTPLLLFLSLMWGQLRADNDDIHQRMRAAEHDRDRMEQRLREIQADVDRVERRTRSLPDNR